MKEWFNRDFQCHCSEVSEKIRQIAKILSLGPGELTFSTAQTDDHRPGAVWVSVLVYTTDKKAVLI